jgi:hypothetical protein
LQIEKHERPNWKPVAYCTTGIRLLAVAKLRDLKLEALKMKEEYLLKVDEAIREIDDIVKD